MYNNDYMYAIERNEDYLAHYGIRGMKWGVRKAIASGNSARLGRQYAKAQKKLAKLDKAAANSGKYARRAAKLGVGAAAAGGLAALGTRGVGTAISGIGDVGSRALRGAGEGLTSLGNRAGRLASSSGAMNPRLRRVLGRSSQVLKTAGAGASTAAGDAFIKAKRGANAVIGWGNSDSLSRAIRRPMLNGAVANGGVVGKGLNTAQGALRGVSNNTIARIGAGAVGAGLAAGAARNAYKAATAKKKAAKFRSEMNKAFAGTKYANGGGSSSSRPRQGKKRRRS